MNTTRSRPNSAAVLALFAATASGSSPHMPPRLRLPYGSALTPP